MLISASLIIDFHTKVDIIGTSGFVLKTQYNTDKSGLEKKVNDADKKIPNTNGLAKAEQIIMLRSLTWMVKYLALLAELLLLCLMM